MSFIKIGTGTGTKQKSDTGQKKLGVFVIVPSGLKNSTVYFYIVYLLPK